MEKSKRGKEQNKYLLISFLLRSGLAIVFLYAGVSAFLNPTAWIGFVPMWIRNIISENIFLPIHATLDVVIGIWLISGKKIFYASIVASLAILSILIFNIGALEILFRDVAILFMALALVALSYRKKGK